MRGFSADQGKQRGESQTKNKNGFLRAGSLEEPFFLTNMVSTYTDFSLSAFLSLSSNDAHNTTLRADTFVLELFKICFVLTAVTSF